MYISSLEYFMRMKEGDAYGTPCSFNGSPIGLHLNPFNRSFLFFVFWSDFGFKMGCNDYNEDLK